MRLEKKQPNSISNFYFAGRPFSLQNCTVSNQSSDSLQVDCVEGFDGGLPQGFLLELVEMPSLRLVRNLSLLVSLLFRGRVLENSIKTLLLL